MKRFHFAGRLAFSGCSFLARWVVARPAAAQLRGACGVYALCLGDDRFQIAAAWQDPATGDQNVARAVTLTADSGYFWFFNDRQHRDHGEDARRLRRQRLRVGLRLRDDQRPGHADGDRRPHRRLQAVRESRRDSRSLPIQDTAAFSSCPGPPGRRRRRSLGGHVRLGRHGRLRLQHACPGRLRARRRQRHRDAPGDRELLRLSDHGAFRGPHWTATGSRER